MPYCEKCGVEVDDGVRACPLCGQVIHGQETMGESSASACGQAPEDREDGESEVNRSLLAMEAMSVVAGISALLCMGIDLWSSRGAFSWSLYVFVGLAMAWLPASMPIIFRKKPWLTFATVAPGELLFLFLLNVIYVIRTGSGNWWFLSYAMPIYLLSLGTVTATVVLVAILKTKGLNVAGIILGAIAIECLGLEIILDLAGGHGLNLEWAPIVAIAAIPASGLSFYFHYRIMKGTFRRSFRV